MDLIPNCLTTVFWIFFPIQIIKIFFQRLEMQYTYVLLLITFLLLV